MALHHVKPHGALYRMLNDDEALGGAFARGGDRSLSGADDLLPGTGRASCGDEDRGGDGHRCGAPSSISIFPTRMMAPSR